MIGGFKSVRAVFGCTLYAFINDVTLADTVHLKNGDIFSGKIISLQNGLCIFDTKYGAAVWVSTSEMKSMAADASYTVHFINGDTAAGRLQLAPDGTTRLNSPTFGLVSVDVDIIQALTRDFADEKSVGKQADKANVGPAAQQYGEDMYEQAPLDFLTGSTVLLAPGQFELDMGAAYTQNRSQYSLGGYFQKSSYVARRLELRTSLRAGLDEGLEGYVTVPVTYSTVQDVSTNEYVRDTDAWEMGDLGFGVQYQLIEESLARPAVSLTFDVTAPTGRKRYNDALNNWKDPLNNGSGHWSVAPGLAFVRSTDPAILFGGLSYRHFFPETIDGYRLKPGWMINSYAGAGLALNEKLSVGSRLSYAYSSKLTADGETIYGSDADPLDLSVSASYRLSGDWVASPELTFGLNDDAGPATLSLNFRRRFN
ncbi:transporter [Pseudomonas sp. LP_7_YM]|uniref:transporter n=1 Tax=Pseudomonas sp. LP_7_YM TaxID=2485137 RepID=UPI00105CA488|nr:transporter [Pseudomonas sp. LP_7_YM]TDV61781.1 outer membrane putative beta-barrel porin/alpha-amylase [Pseudomonas sp. LP_7_YM]